MTYFLRYYGKIVSCWLTVAITVERYIGIAHPLQASVISTKRVTLVVITSIYVIGAALTAFPFWTMKIIDRGTYTFCGDRDAQEYNRWNWAILKVGSLVLPCALIFIFTFMIIASLRRMKRQRAQMTTTSDDVSSKTALETQLTVMLLTVAVVTLILRLPYTIVYVPFKYKYDIWERDEFEDTWAELYLHIIRDVCYVIASVNYMINFFLFCLTGSILRKNLAACLRCKQVKARPLSSKYNRATVVTASTNSNSNWSINRLNRQSTSPQHTPQLMRLQEPLIHKESPQGPPKSTRQ